MLPQRKSHVGAQLKELGIQAARQGVTEEEILTMATPSEP